MNVESMLKQLDELFDTGKIKEVEGFLKEKLGEAKAEADGGAMLAILNEQIGYYRVMTQYDKALDTIGEIKSVLLTMNLAGTIAEATSLLNIATVYRAMGKLGDAEECYQKAELLYEELLEPTDYRVAGLYNNMSLFYQESGAYEKAIACQKKAIAVIEQIEGSLIQQAISYTNLGQTYCKMQNWELAKEALMRSESLFEEAGVVEEHYSGFASAMGYYYVNQKEYEEAIIYYEKALLNSYQTSGVTKNFKQIQTDLQNVYKLAGKEVCDSMLDVCQAYYEQVGKPMIHEQFATYEDKIAVGLCGEGSECFGMEDAISLDHDCGPGFAMWLDDETYAQIGEELQKAYEALPKVFMGYIRNDSAMGQGRCGVCTIDSFFERVLGENSIPTCDAEWRAADETALCTATNGRIFVDKMGEFTSKRELLLAYYPRHIWLEKLARKLIYSAQTGQYNYGRMMARGEFVAANIALSEYMQSTMQVVYMLNTKYTPYYKWLRAGMKDLSILPEVGDIMEAICDMPTQRQAWEGFAYNGNPNPNDMIAGAIEIVAKLITDRLNQMGLSDSVDPYLETQGKEVLKRI